MTRMLRKWLRLLCVVILSAGAPSVGAAPPIGCLSIHSDIGKSDSSFAYLDGHSWLQFHPAPSAGTNLRPFTVGTWGIDPIGVRFDAETKRHPGAFRRKEIDAGQFLTLKRLIEANNRWKPSENCSHFAMNVWNAVTGENLSNFTNYDWQRAWDLHEIPAPSPRGLFTSIFAQNDNKFNNIGWQSKAANDRPPPPYRDFSMAASCDNFDFNRWLKDMGDQPLAVPTLQ